MRRLVSLPSSCPSASDWVQFGFSQIKSLVPTSSETLNCVTETDLPNPTYQDIHRIVAADKSGQIQFVALIGSHPICAGKLPTSAPTNAVAAVVYFRHSKLVVEHLGSARDASKDIRKRFLRQKFTVTPGGAVYRPYENWVRRGAYSPTDFAPSIGINVNHIEHPATPNKLSISDYTLALTHELRPTWKSVSSGEERLALLRTESRRGASAMRTPFGVVPTIYMDLNAYGNPLKIADDISSTARKFVGNTHGQSQYAQWSTQLLTGSLAGIAAHFGADLSHYDTLMRGVGFTGAFQSYLEHVRRAIPLIAGESVTFKAGAVAVSEIEHHSNSLPFLEWTNSVFQVPIKDGVVDWKQLGHFLSDQATKKSPFIVIAASMQSNVTSLKTDISEIQSVVVDFLQHHPSYNDRIFISLDLAAYAPHGELNLSGLYRDTERKMPLIDGISFSPYKLDGGQQGVSVLLVSKRLTGDTPVNMGGGSVEHVYDVTQKGVRWHSHAEEAIDLHNSGSPNVLGVFNTWLGIHFKEWVGVDAIQNAEKMYTRWAYGELHGYQTSSTAAAILGPTLDVRGNTLPLVVSFKEGETWYQTPPALVTLALEQFFGITSRSGCNCAGPYGHTLFSYTPKEMDQMDQHLLGFRSNRKSTMTRPGWSRVTVSPLLTPDEVTYFINSVKLFVDHHDKIARHYRYNDETGGYIPSPVEIGTKTMISGGTLATVLDGFIEFNHRPESMLTDRLDAVRNYLETCRPEPSNTKETIVAAWNEWESVKHCQ